MIMLSSADALSACKQHYSIDVSRARVVRFAVPPPAAVNEASARATADRYGLPADYFFMPNQYYVHKNHTLVLEALLALRRRGRRVVVMAPGRHFDPSNMPYVDGFLKRLRDEQITDQFIAPGLIPYEDLADLMHASVALLNPSLYEGWSTTVEEARSAGVPMLLSDIDVHKEQAGDQARYFAPREAAGLADLLQSYVPLSAEARTLRRLAAGIDAQARLQTYARNFVDLSRESIDREV